MYIGKALRRREDGRFLRGRGTYVDDVTLPNTAFAAFVRSPHAHAIIKGFSTDKAKAMPGVLAVVTAEDWRAAGLGEAPVLWEIASRDGQPMNEIARPILTEDCARFVGDTLAMVVAETPHQARDAAEAVEVDYDPQPAMVDLAHALDDGVPLVHEAFGTNRCFDYERGDAKAVEAAFAKAAHVTKLPLNSNRLAPSPIEPRAVLGQFDSVREHYTLWTTTQNPHMVRRWLAENSLLVPEHKIRVVSPDVGGGFGQKIYHYPEEPAVLWASKLTGRPVRWTSSRTEAFLVDTHARDHVTIGEMAFAEDGTILAVRCETIANMGAYLSPFGACVPPFAAVMLPGVYTTAAAFVRIRGAFTHTTPVDAYRGAGRPEFLFVHERLLENGAREVGIDAAELRERNFIQPDQFPYTSPLDVTYDSGDLPGLMSKLKDLGHYSELRAEQARLRDEGTLMGIGFAAFMDSSGFGPSKVLAATGGRVGGWDMANVRVHPTGKVTVFCGSHNHGQGHATSFAQVVADKLGCDFEDVEIVEGDTDKIPYGTGTYASRSMSVTGAAMAVSTERIIAKGSTLAAHLLEAAEEDISFENGEFVVKGTDRKLTFKDVVHAAYYGADYPEGFELGLEETVYYDPPDFNYPSAIHLCVVIVDPETGKVSLRDYSVADDVGVMINPMIIEGQIHGGLVQGIGAALMEDCRYDGESGQLVAGSFMDYGMPRAMDIPLFGLVAQETPAPGNPLGVKGAGESGTIGAPSAVVNAVVDALWHLGVRNIEPPVTPARVRDAIQAAVRH